MVPMKRLTWVMPPVITAGSASIQKRRTSGSIRGNWNFGRNPAPLHRPPDRRKLRDAGDHRRDRDPDRRALRLLHREGHERDQHRDVDDVEDHRRERRGEVAVRAN